MENKHAYLIMAHGNWNLLEVLIRMLDYELNDIYIHIDKAVNNFDYSRFQNICKKSNVIFSKERINVKWGDSTQVQTELTLFELAAKKKYKYYHLISGVDLPLKTQPYIHEFFENDDKEYIFLEKEYTQWDYARLSRYRFPITFNPKFLMVTNIIQDKFNIDRFKKYNMEFKKGYNWCSLTDDAVRFIIKNKSKIKRMCAMSSCADECYKQIILWNSKFKNRIYKDDNGNYNDLREIDWKRRVGSSPHVYTIDDFEMLKSSNNLFARKFDEKVDSTIIKEISELVLSNNK